MQQMGQGNFPGMPGGGMFGGGMGNAYAGAGNRPPAPGWRGYTGSGGGAGAAKKKKKDKKKKGFGNL